MYIIFLVVNRKEAYFIMYYDFFLLKHANIRLSEVVVV